MTTNSPAPDDIAAQKSSIRKQMLSQRKALLPQRLAELSLRAQPHILSLPAWQAARQVLLYSPVNGELDTSLLIENALAGGKSVLLPRCIPEQRGCMEFAAFKGQADLCPGQFGILEPDPASCPAVEAQHFNPQIAIIPGLAFTCGGLRLGYGGGYYDRFLSKKLLDRCFLVGFCAGFQILDFIPHQQWDLKVDAVCTENGLISCNSQG